MHTSWTKIFNEYPNKKELNLLLDTIEEKRKTTTIYPPKELVFKTFDLAINNIKVVILGQDPYHNEDQACGLSFSVNNSTPLPKSLINIYKELADDLKIKEPINGDLTPWLNQGVFLLNSVLTVEKNKPGSHRNLGWENFTDYIISQISSHRKNIIFVLWGNYAKNKEPLINKSKHHIISSPHPSPLSAYRGFLGSKPFSKINNILKKIGEKEINFDSN